MAMTIGVAGITGKFARLVVKSLLGSTEATIRGFCRNPSKLPEHIRSNPRVTIHQGDSYDLDALRSFVRGCDVVICCYLGDNNFMIEGRSFSDYCLDFTKLEFGQHPAKDPMKYIKAYVETKDNVKGVHVLIGAFMETFWSGYFGVWNPDEFKLSYYGSGDEIWESTRYETAAEYVAAVALDRSAVGLQHFLGDRKDIRQIADELADVYGKKPQLQRLGSLQDLYTNMQAKFAEDPSNIFAYLALFYQYYCTNGQTYLKEDLDNVKYPQVKPVTFRKLMQAHTPKELSDSYQNAGSYA